MKSDFDIRIIKLIQLSEQWYQSKKFKHALRVACYASNAALKNPEVNSTDAFLVGLTHDLIEDTEYPQDQLEEILGPELFTAVLDLTKDDKDSYQEYIERVLATGDDLTILVKRADMKDHMTQLDTLTDKLRDKYLPVLHYFL